MHIHILGICGTFMGTLALLARDAGFKVTGSDTAAYPPMNNLLADKGIVWTEGYDNHTELLKADCVVIGNAIKRGNPALEVVLSQGLKYLSGPDWLHQNILTRYKVIAIAGTHGKTTTTSMLAHILNYAGLNPGFLIGGVAANFDTSACLGDGEYFVIEADEYDTAFFDKRPKFMHYQPAIAIINNLEFDHADIYQDLNSIQQQFHYFLRTIPQNGLAIVPFADAAIDTVLAMGVYSEIQSFAINDDKALWSAKLNDAVGSNFDVYFKGNKVANVTWSLIGDFNVSNALVAIATAFRVGVDPMLTAEALQNFMPVKRRLEVKAEIDGITVYDDFAHHPTAIEKTINALKLSNRHKRILVVMEFASYTMRQGLHALRMAEALKDAAEVFILKPESFDIKAALKSFDKPYYIADTVDELAMQASKCAQKGDAILVMSNRGFAGIHNILHELLLLK